MPESNVHLLRVMSRVRYRTNMPAVHPCQRHERHARSRVLQQSTQAYRSTGLTAFVVTDRLQPRSHRPRAHCSSTVSKSRTHQESALQLDLGRLVETCSARYRHRRSEVLDVPPAYHVYKKATARNAPIAVAQVALHEKEPLHEPRKSGARLFTKGFNPNQAIAGKPDLEGSRQPLDRKAGAG